MVNPKEGEKDKGSGDFVVDLDNVVAAPGSKDDTTKSDAAAAAGNEKKKRIPFFTLYRYSTLNERFLFVFAVFCAGIHGAAWPVWSLLFGLAIGQFDANHIEDTVSGMRTLAIIFTAAGVGIGIAAGLYVGIFSLVGVRQNERIRRAFVRSVLRQDMAFHEQNAGAKLDVMLQTALNDIQSPLGTKLGAFLQNVFQGIIGLVIAFAYGWKLTLVVMAFSPVLMMSMATFAQAMSSSDTVTAKAYQAAGVVADEVMTLIRYVMQFSTYDAEISRYAKHVASAHAAARKAGNKIAFALGLPDFAVFSLYALVFWYGASLVRDGEIGGQDIILVMFSAMIGFMGLGQSLATYQEFLGALASAAPVFEIIDRVPGIDSLSETGEKPTTFNARIQFKDVKFSYPAAPSDPVLKGVSFTANPGDSIAFVGASGSGKSTIVSLVQRFYDIQEGEILVDGHSIKDVNVQWFRSKIGLVSQMPVLFPTTIFENIAIGKPGATLDDVIRAAKMANAHDFINDFALKYDTEVGELGGKISGGQKQRIAIARVLISDPKILILDEATSALDNQSEAVVQEYLDSTQKNRTTITIAHRLSTIKNATRIFVMDHGQIIEEGTQQELIEKQGAFFKMLQAQATSGNEEESKQDGEAEIEEVKKEDDAKAKEAETAEIAKRLPGWELTKWAWQMSKPDLPHILMSFFGACVLAVEWPVQAIILARALDTVLGSSQESDILPYTYTYIGLACINMVGHFLRHSQASLAGDNLTLRMRKRLFHVFVNQSPGWFDAPEHSNAHLREILATDVARVRFLVGEGYSLYLLVAVMLASSLTIALVYCWRVALVVLACIPPMVVSGAMMMRLMFEATSAKEGKMKLVKQITSRIVTNVKLITQLTASNHMLDLLAIEQLKPIDSMKRGALRIAIAAVFAQFVQFATFALAFYYGSITVQDGDCSFSDMFTAMIGILFAAIMSGVYLGQLPNIQNAKVSTHRVREIFKSCQPVESRSLGDKDFSISKGEIEFRDISFTYPTRPNNPIFEHFNIKIKAGEKVAIVGASGSGKSTITALVQRFYDPSAGQILIDGKDIHTMNVDILRQHIGVVSQEPRLFNLTINENVRYGEDSAHPFSNELVQKAIQSANADRFINEFKLGLESPVGQLGSQLSGGQRQRVAISRIFMRDPKILLLDEATSALDSESEQLVQAAMDRAAIGRTTIIIAHRLSTIKDADRIVVLDNGKVCEQGTHTELLALKGKYCDLYTSSNH